MEVLEKVVRRHLIGQTNNINSLSSDPNLSEQCLERWMETSAMLAELSSAGVPQRPQIQQAQH